MLSIGFRGNYGEKTKKDRSRENRKLWDQNVNFLDGSPNTGFSDKDDLILGFKL